MDKKKRRIAIDDLPANAQADVSEDEFGTVTGGALLSARWAGLRKSGNRTQGIRADEALGLPFAGFRPRGKF